MSPISLFPVDAYPCAGAIGENLLQVLDARVAREAVRVGLNPAVFIDLDLDSLFSHTSPLSSNQVCLQSSGLGTAWIVLFPDVDRQVSFRSSLEQFSY